jgi:hypothetical protein
MSDDLSLTRRILDESSLDDDDDDEFIRSAAQIIGSYSLPTKKCGDSIPEHLYVYRDRDGGHDRMYQDYLANDPTYGPVYFRRRFACISLYYFICLTHCIMYDLHAFSHRFRISRELFVRTINDVEEYDDYFVRRMNATGQFGLRCFQKVTTVFCMLTYGMPDDATDEYCRIGESTTLKCLRMFTKAIVALFGEEYLRSPNENDTTRLFALGEDRGIPSMLGSIDCMCWSWKNCRSA